MDVSKPNIDEQLYLYLAVSPVAISAMLVYEQDNFQKPVYYTSRVLHDMEIRYIKLEKLIFALIVTARRLRSYFLTHLIVVLMD